MTTIFTRWMTAADRMGPYWNGFAGSTVGDVAQVLSLCEETALADEMRVQGPRVLTALDTDRRFELAAKVDPTLGPGLRQMLQREAVELERHVATDVPARLVVFGRAMAGETLPAVMAHEFPHQRGSALFLARPTPAALIDLSAAAASRHQWIWPEPAREPREDMRPISRLPLPRLPATAGGIFDFDKLAGFNFLSHLFYSHFASQGFVTIDPGQLVRYGGLRLVSLQDRADPGLIADVALASGLQTVPGTVPLAFLHREEGPRDTIPFVEDRARVFLDDPRQRYARIDFDPQERNAVVAVVSTRNRRTIARTTLRLHKDRVIGRRLEFVRPQLHADLAESIAMDLRGPGKTKRAEKQAARAVAIAQLFAARYLEWLEWRPEAPVAHREEELIALEGAMMAEAGPITNEHERGLMHRDLYHTFKGFLIGWGLRPLPKP